MSAQHRVPSVSCEADFGLNSPNSVRTSEWRGVGAAQSREFLAEVLASPEVSFLHNQSYDHAGAGRPMNRKLSAILAADVVGYTALMERDEAGTFERLRAERKEWFEPEIARHHGHIFKLMGDGMLADFDSV